MLSKSCLASVFFRNLLPWLCGNGVPQISSCFSDFHRFKGQMGSLAHSPWSFTQRVGWDSPHSYLRSEVRDRIKMCQNELSSLCSFCSQWRRIISFTGQFIHPCDRFGCINYWGCGLPTVSSSSWVWLRNVSSLCLKMSRNGESTSFLSCAADLSPLVSETKLQRFGWTGLILVMRESCVSSSGEDTQLALCWIHLHSLLLAAWNTKTSRYLQN